jgi:hypothetical protein
MRVLKPFSPLVVPFPVPQSLPKLSKKIAALVDPVAALQEPLLINTGEVIGLVRLFKPNCP